MQAVRCWCLRPALDWCWGPSWRGWEAMGQWCRCTQEEVPAGVESFPSHFHDTLHEFPICHINALLAGTLDTEAKDIDADAGQANGDKSNLTRTDPEKAEGNGGSPDTEDQSMETSTSTDPAEDKEREKRREIRAQEKKVRM